MREGLLTSTEDAPEVEEGAVEELESYWRNWLKTLFASHLTDADGDFVPFADVHAELWEWIWSIRRGRRVRPFVGGWPRGFAKSTTAEMGMCALGARKTRSYVLYVCETQDQADDHLKNIQELLEGVTVGAYYPDLGNPSLNKFGHSDGWRRNRLRTSSGLTVDAMGLDSSRRGAKVGKFRPDLIVIDDIDGEQDTPQTTAKKTKTLTERILPSGADGLAVLVLQNKVHDNSIVSRLLDGRADFLADRIVSGPVKAIDGLEYEQRGGRYVITGGTARWAGMDLDRCQEIIDTEGISAFLKERQNETQEVAGGMFDHLSYRRCSWDEVPWHAIERTVVWVDPAVTNTDSSDSHGIQADSLSADGTIYRLYSWEDRTSPRDVLRRAILKAVELKAEAVGVETDQGGDVWRSAYDEAARSLVEEGLIRERDVPAFRSAKAGSGHGSKAHRGGLMLAAYERGRFVHVIGTHDVLERALRRFPKAKPLDLVDAAYWSYSDLEAGGGAATSSREMREESDFAGMGFGDF